MAPIWENQALLKKDFKKDLKKILQNSQEGVWFLIKCRDYNI